MDCLVTLPKSFGLAAWIAEGSDLPGAPWSGESWDFYLWGTPPDITPLERVYVVYNSTLRGYAPLVRICLRYGRSYSLVRHGGAVAVTIDREIKGFRGWRYRDWSYDEERPFPDWMHAEGVA